MIVPAQLNQLLRKYGLTFLHGAVQQLHGKPAATLRDEAKYRDTLVTEAWKAAPLQMRMLDPGPLNWDGFCLALRDRVFDASGPVVKLRPNWEQQALALLDESGAAAAVTSKFLAGETAPGETLPGETAAGDSPTTAERDKTNQTAIGIDLGTTYSVVAHLDHQGRPTSILNAAGDILTPSVVLFDHEGTIVGKEAVQAASAEPDRVAVCVKRDMGSKFFRHKINGEQLPPEVISSYILRRLKADAERKLGQVQHAVITVPAYFDDTRRRATMDAGRLAGLQVLDILNEPTAAAIAYGYQEGFLDREVRVKGDRPLKVLVYDLGGGTFDVTIVELGGQSFKAIATDGDVQLGGKDWDEKLVDMAADRFQKAHRQDPRADPQTLQEMWQTAEQAKKTLTERSKATMYVNYRGTRFKCEVTRQEFEEATAPLLLRTRTTTEIVVLQAGLTWPEIDKVLLVGGSTRMLAVELMIKDLIGRDPDRSISADEAVAHGAALYANLLMQSRGDDEGHAQFSITNINSHSLGVVGIEPATGRRVNSVIIPKNTPLPYTAGRKFKTAKTGQPNIRVCVVEGESEMPEACVEVGTCLIRNLPPNLPAGWPVEVRYSYHENGRLQVAARLVGHDAAVTTEFVRDNSLTDDDLMLWAECLEAEAKRQDGG